MTSASSFELSVSSTFGRISDPLLFRRTFDDNKGRSSSFNDAEEDDDEVNFGQIVFLSVGVDDDVMFVVSSFVLI
jgi:hypothetical protein